MLIKMNCNSHLISIFIAMMVGISACKKANDSPKQAVSAEPETSIYICGTDEDYNGLGDIGVYWKNNQQQLLTTGTTGKFNINAIAVSDSGDVYVVGNKINTLTGMTEAVLWKNGLSTRLTNGNNNAYANAVFISQGNVYVAGTDGNKAIYWMNGNPVTLSENGSAASIFVSGKDIYVAGSDGNNTVYWKNGIATNIGNGSYSQSVYSICVYGGDVYLAGQRRYLNATNTKQIATYWKNGVAIEVGNAANHSQANTIYVSDIGDIYVLGWEELSTGNALGKYWKNGIPVSLTSNAVSSFANAICITKGDVYVAGSKKNTNGVGIPMAAYWKNGEEVVLSNRQSVATGIVVR